MNLLILNVLSQILEALMAGQRCETCITSEITVCMSGKLAICNGYTTLGTTDVMC